MLEIESIFNESYFMKQALIEAQKAYDDDEVPIGAVVVIQQMIIGRGYNQVERLKDATAHAEMIAITAASNYMGNKYLEGCEIYITLEPCVMCFGAIKASRFKKLVFGASEPKTGFSNFIETSYYKKIEITNNVEAIESKTLLQEFFLKKRGLQN